MLPPLAAPPIESIESIEPIEPIAAPDPALAWAARALAHEAGARWAEAAACYEAALALAPRRPAILLNLAGVLARLQRHDEAEGRCRAAIALQPQAAPAWSNLGALLTGLHRDADAMACCLHALRLDPAYAPARFNLSLPLLRQGRWAEGLLCLEARPSLAAMAQQMPLPRWAGEALAGRSLLLVSDAGHGDLIQMARYAPLLRQRGARRLRLLAPPGLQRLLARGAGFDEVLTFDQAFDQPFDQPFDQALEPAPATGCDLWAPTSSLPHLCATRVDAVPASLPYLQPDPARAAHWRAWLDAECAPGVRPAPGAPRIGLVWRGDPRHQNDAHRSLPGLAALAALAALPGLRWISLQCGAGADEPLQPGAALPVQALPAPLRDFDDTAALVAGLDLVIGVDTATVHLAGALGRPTWVLLPHHLTDWRWLEARSDSPWYPGVMRLFRQPRLGDWAGAVQALVAALRDAFVSPLSAPWAPDSTAA